MSCRAAVIGVVLLAASVSHAQEKRGEMTVVDYEGLKREVLKQRGKVLVVDFWSST